MGDINVNQVEIRSTREVARELVSILAELESGAVPKIVVMAGSHMKGVIVSVDEYARLIAKTPEPDAEGWVEDESGFKSM